jgi:hypothetical protein
LEPLESRTLLSYTFTYNAATTTATVAAVAPAAAQPLVISPVGAQLEWSVNGAAFSNVWTNGPVPVPGVTVIDVTLDSGAGASLQFGGNSGLAVGGGPASTVAAALNVTVPTNTTDSVIIDDSGSTAATTYTVNLATGLRTITATTPPAVPPTINYTETGPALGGGITLKGSSGVLAVDTYNVLSTFSGEPVNIVGGSGTNTVNVGNAGTLVGILSPVTVSDLLGSMTLNLLETGDTTGTGATITNSSVTGLNFGTGGKVNYTGVTTLTGGVTALNVTDGSALVSTYNVESTSAATTLSTGSNTGDIVNVGSDPVLPSSDSTLGGIKSLVTVHDLTGSATLNLLDAGDTTTALPATITGAAVSGWGFGAGGSVDYTGVVAPATGGVTALNLDGGTSPSGVTYNFNSTSTNTTLNGDPDTVNITGTGVAFGTILTINDTGATLNYNAGGFTPLVTANPNGVIGDVVIALTPPPPVPPPGFGVVDANGIAQLNLTPAVSVPAIPITLVAGTINTVEGFNLADAIVATFKAPLTAIFPGTGGLPASFFTATINWGDGTVALPDLTAGTITQDAENPSVYDVTGTHTFVDNGSYTVATTVFLKAGTQTISSVVNGVPVNVTVNFLSSGPTTVTPAVPNATVTQGSLVVSAFPIVGTEGTAIAASATAANPIPIATFIDAGGADPLAAYSATITIVDPATGLPVAGYPVALPAGSITQNANAAQYTVSTLAPLPALPEEGTYQVLVAVTDSDGVPPGPITTSGASTAVIADAALAALPLAAQPAVVQDEPTIFPVPVFGSPAFTGPVATFTDANPAAPVGDFTATIDWGDGTPESAGTVAQPGGTGTAFVVAGSHTYADAGAAGTYPIQVFVTDVGGSKLTIPNVAAVADNPIAVTGNLNPASDSGKFNNDGITNVTQPDFSGTVLALLPTGRVVPEGNAHVSLLAVNQVTGVITSIGTVQAGGDGSWNIRSTVALANGDYAIVANAVDQFGVTKSAPVVITPFLLIDTVGPRITNAAFNRLTGTVTFTFQDFPQSATSGESGLLVQSLSDAANYSLIRLNARPAGTFIVTNIIVTPGATPGSDNVAVVFNNGAPIKGGNFQIIARAESALLRSGIQDLAGNALDGEFYGPQSASGNGVPGGDFVANVTDIHQGTPGFGNSGPITIIGTPHPDDPPGNFKVTTKPVVVTKAKVKVTTPAKVRVEALAKPKLTAEAVAAARRK